MALPAHLQQLMSTMTTQQIGAALQMANQNASSMMPSKDSKRAKGKKNGPLAANSTPKATRPLNSWIAFRSYYSTIFASLQQKEISGFLTYMWQTDPFKAKWSILAKAYSMIRDEQGKNKTPLEDFLAINGPLIGIIEPANYLQALGWQISVDGQGQAVVQRVATAIDPRKFITNISVNDVIRHSYHQGYFTGNLFNVLLTDNDATMTMATSMQRATNNQDASTDDDSSHQTPLGSTSAYASSTGQGGMEVSQDSGEQANATSGEVDATTQSHSTEMLSSHGSTAGGNSIQGNSGIAIDAPSNLGASTVSFTTTTEQSTAKDTNFDWNAWLVASPTTEATEENYASVNELPAERLNPADFIFGDEWPVDAHFDPESPGFVFDPFEGNQFDAFDMSGGWEDIVGSGEL